MRSGTLYKWSKFYEDSGYLALELAEGISGSSATDIARIAGSRAAWLAACKVGSSCLIASSNEQEIKPVGHFPFEGKTDLTVHGRWLATYEPARTVFLVYRIASCTHPFPFKKLTYKVRKVGFRKAEAAFGNAQSHLGSHRRGDAVQAHLEELDASTRLAPQTFTFQRDRQFPDLEKKFITGKHRFSAGAPPGPGSGSEPITEFALGSTGTGDRRKEALLDEERPLERVPAFLRPVLHALQGLRGVEVELLTGDLDQSCTQSIDLLVDEDGVIADELLVDDGAGFRPRQFAAFLVTKEETRLILVFIESDPVYPLAYPTERNDDEEAHATMVCATKDYLRRVRGVGAPDFSLSLESSAEATGPSPIEEWVMGYF